MSTDISKYIEGLPSKLDQLKVIEAKFVAGMEGKDPLKVAVQLKTLEDLVKNLRSNTVIRSYIMNEADKYPDKTFKIDGVGFEKSETGVKFDFSKCEDSEYDELIKKKATIDNKIKSKTAFLKKLKEPYVKIDTGEIINPPLRTSNSYIKISLK